jgi:serine protease Do
MTTSILASYLGLQPTAVAVGSLLAPSPANRMHVALTVAAAPVDFPAIVERYGPAVVNISAAAPDQQTAAANALGITVQDVDPGLARAFGLPRPAGALVDAVAPDSPAAAGGLKPGDVIVRVGDKATDRARDLLDYIAGLPPGTNVALGLFRNRRPLTMTVKVVASAQSAGTAQDDASAADRLGLAVRPLSAGERQANALAAGLMVDAVSGPAANAGIQPGDIVLALDGTPVTSREQLATLAARGGEHVALLIMRDNIRSIVSVRLRYYYHCARPEGYYPYVKACPGGWERVPTEPPDG